MIVLIDAAVCVGAVMFVSWLIALSRGGSSSGRSTTRAEVARQDQAHRTIDGLYDRAEQQVRSVVEQHRREQ